MKLLMYAYKMDRARELDKSTIATCKDCVKRKTKLLSA